MTLLAEDIDQLQHRGTPCVHARETALASIEVKKRRLHFECLESRVVLASDFGDAPLPFPTVSSDEGANHAAFGPTLGRTRDIDANGQASFWADGDGADEDGVEFGPLTIGQVATMVVDVGNTTTNVRMDAWMDFNGDRNWGGVGEQIFDSQLVSHGVNPLRFQIPSWSLSGLTYARVRLSIDGDLGHGGRADTGEVEDYVVAINPAPGHGDFPFNQHYTVDSNADGAFSVYAADLDGDGDQDVLSASRGDQTIRWYENSAGVFLPGSEQIVSEGQTGIRSVVAADVDGDGDLDVVGGLASGLGELSGEVAWFENRLNEPLALVPWIRHFVRKRASVRSVHAADMDGDGDMDLLSASHNDDTVALFRNDGNENFSFELITDSMDGARSVVAADMDGDGDMDVVAASQRDDTVAWYESTFSQPPLPVLPIWVKHTLNDSADGASTVLVSDV